MKRLLITLLVIALVVVIADASFAAPAAKWSAGDEAKVFGHTFEEGVQALSGGSGDLHGVRMQGGEPLAKPRLKL